MWNIARRRGRGYRGHELGESAFAQVELISLGLKGNKGSVLSWEFHLRLRKTLDHGISVLFLVLDEVL